MKMENRFFATIMKSLLIITVYMFSTQTLSAQSAKDVELANALPANLEKLSDRSATPKPLYLMNSSHQDIAWMDSPFKCELFRDTLVITPLLERMEKDPNYHFDIEDVLMIREYIGRHPDRKALVKRFLDNGQLNVGGAFNMPYEDMYGGESLIREFYQGSLWMYKNFQYWPTTYWNVDVPGRTFQMPQILAKSGIKMMVLSRMGKGLFNWEVPDGSKVLTFSPGHYGDMFFAFYNKKDMNSGLSYLADYTSDIEKQALGSDSGSISVPLLWDMDMAASGGTASILNNWNHLDDNAGGQSVTKKLVLPRIKYATSPEVYNALKSYQNKLPDIIGERPDVWLYIHGPSHERALHASRDADILLPAAEKFATINSILDGNFDHYPTNELENAWENKIYPDHGWGGKNGEITDNFFLQKFLSAKSEGENILNNSLKAIASRIQFKSSLGTPVVVFNDLSWKRDAPVNATMKFSPGTAFGVKIVNSAGKDILSQASDEEYYNDHSLKSVTVSFIAQQVPSIGFSTFYAVPSKAKNNSTQSAKNVQENQVFESDYYRIQPGEGGLTSIFDKETNTELLDTQKFMGAEIFTMHSKGNGAGEFADIQQPDMEGFDKTSLHPTQWKIVEDGPVFTALQFRSPLKYADAQLTVKLYKHLKRIDFNVDILNWEGVLYREFRMAMPLKMDESKVAYAVPFGILRVGENELHRAAGERYKTDCREVHPRGIDSWIGAANDKKSVTLSSDVAVADYIDPTTNPVAYTILQPILFASRKSCNGEGNDYLQTGDHHFTFPFTSGSNDIMKQNREGISNHEPLFVVVNLYKSAKAFLKEDGSFFNLDNKDVLISAIKKSEDGDKVCIRSYNVSGKNQEATLHCFGNMTHPVKTNLIEQPLLSLQNQNTHNNLKLKFEKNSIETFTAEIKK
ncbi:MAG TPA: glycosyl hydrolase-related protein [Hanamia sp.]|nr:glycosyl hydrolase-related protein [Hanamia sp.]